jgi:hypothetical protein
MVTETDGRLVSGIVGRWVQRRWWGNEVLDVVMGVKGLQVRRQWDHSAVG